MTTSTPPRRLGLTGGIGSGKSTAATIFAELGAIVIDADAISRQITASSGVAIAAIERQFGAIYIHPDRSLNRDLMRQLVFENPPARQDLEAITHPLIQSEMRRQYDSAVAFGTRLAVYDLPLLAESALWHQNLDTVLVIDCSTETQIERALRRGVMTGKPLSRDMVERIIASQSSRLDRLKIADYVILNDNITMDQLRTEVTQIARLCGL